MSISSSSLFEKKKNYSNFYREFSIFVYGKKTIHIFEPQNMQNKQNLMTQSPENDQKAHFRPNFDNFGHLRAKIFFFENRASSL